MTPIRPTYSLFDAMFASPTEPMPFPMRDYQLLAMYNGLDKLTNDDSPTKDDWRVICDAVNMTETLIETGVAEDTDGLLHDATEAMAQAGKRAHVGCPLRLDGPGLIAVRAILTDYRAMLEVLSHRTMVACHRATEKRIREIQAGRKRDNDVEVVNL